MSDVHETTLALAKDLIRRRSITPDDGGCLALVAARLAARGFVCERVDRAGIGNLWARHGTGRPLVCLAGHVDVVPPGSVEQWTADPFSPVERDGFLYGRGASDMKGPLAAMVTAVERVVAARPSHAGSLAVLLTADEEGDATDGTVAVVDALRTRGERIDACLLGEPTSVDRLGDTVKNGRRGSLSGVLTVRGIQAHIAYPERGRNAIHLAVPAIAALVSETWDDGNEYFPPTSFQVSNVRAGTGAPNVTPGTLEAWFNFRFSTASPDAVLRARTHAILDRLGLDYTIAWTLSAEPFLTRPGPLVDTLCAAVGDVTGVTPALSTSGGTSDGRFLAAIADQVVEFGPPNESIHKVDERIAVADLAPLSMIYQRTLETLLG
jgi:succinyl-diaminopimelate desuccinylase